MAMRGAKSRYQGGKMSEGRIAWTRNILVQLVVRYFEPETNGEKTDLDGNLLRDIQVGPNVRIDYKPNHGYKIFGIELTALTEPELAAFKKIMNLAIDLAEPVVKERDRLAKLEDPNSSTNGRVYRALPEVAIREGAFTPYRQGVQLRSEGAPEGPGGAEPGDGGVRGDQRELADEVPPGAGSIVDSSETD